MFITWIQIRQRQNAIAQKLNVYSVSFYILFLRSLHYFSRMLWLNYSEKCYGINFNGLKENGVDGFFAAWGSLGGVPAQDWLETEVAEQRTDGFRQLNHMRVLRLLYIFSKLLTLLEKVFQNKNVTKLTLIINMLLT